MLILEDSNRVLHSSLHDYVAGEGGQREYLDVAFSDFGEGRFHLYVDEASRDNLFLSGAFPGFASLANLGLQAHLEQYLGAGFVFCDRAEPTYDFTLSFPASLLSEESIRKLALLRRECLGLPMELAIRAQEMEQSSQVMAVPLRGADVMYIQGDVDRVTVVLATRFEEHSDAVLGKVFLQEFYDVRRLNNMHNAPAVLFGKEPPNELRQAIPVADGLNYITFVLFPSHFAGEKRQKCISMIVNFREYFYYHIKCCKSYLHTRMRAKVSDFIKTLNSTKSASSQVDL